MKKLFKKFKLFGLIIFTLFNIFLIYSCIYLGYFIYSSKYINSEDKVNKETVSYISFMFENNDSVLFGISPQGNIENNYSSEYLDIKSILSNEGYIDYVMPQIYFGFDNSSKPFIDTYHEWEQLIKVSSIKLIPALALYKSGNVDNYAGKGINEWIDNSDILKRQILYMRDRTLYSGFSIFRYEYFYNSDKWNNNVVNEIENIRKIIKGY